MGFCGIAQVADPPCVDLKTIVRAVSDELLQEEDFVRN
jgi:hypothetical protein